MIEREAEIEHKQKLARSIAGIDALELIYE
jgi:hypothetical protein